MKNRSKLKKIREKSAAAPGIPKEWFYMQQKAVTVRDIEQALKEDDTVNVEIWEEIGVLEVEIPEQKSMDFEQTKPDLRDEYSNAWLAEHEVKSLFFVTLDAENFGKAQEIMQKITGKIGGFFCGDTEDFKPLVK